MKPIHKLMKSRTQVVMRHPFFGTLLLRQRLERSTSVETIATDGKKLYFNEQFVEAAEPDHIEYACARLAMSSALQHQLRMRGRDEAKWQAASVYAVNPILAEAGFHLPDGAVTSFKGKTAEQIYAELPDQPAGGSSQDASGGGAEQPQGSSTDDDEKQQPEPQTESEQDEQDDSDSRQDGSDDEKPQKTPDYEGAGALVDPGLSGAELERESADMRQALSAANRAEPGVVSGDSAIELQALLEPKADWREVLRRFMAKLSKYDYSWEKPNRRFVAQNLYLPSSVPQGPDGMGGMVIIIDASGSMPIDKLKQAMTELRSIADELKPDFIHFMVHDTEIVFSERLGGNDEIETTVVHAGGGTSITPASEATQLIAMNERVDCAVWFTDLLFSESDIERARDEWPEVVPLVWIDYLGRNTKPFGEELVVMED